MSLDFDKASLLHEQGNLGEAEQLYKNVVYHDPTHFEAFHRLGVIAIQTGKSQEGVDLITRAITLNDCNAKAYNNLGFGLLSLGLPEVALVRFEKAISLEPDFVQAHNNRGLALLKMRHWEEALTNCDKALALDPDFSQAYSYRGYALFALKRFDEALASCDKAIALAPDIALSHNTRGLALLKLKRFEEALASFDKAIALEPEYPAAWMNSGIAYFEMNCKAKAIACMDKVIEFDPSNADARVMSCMAELSIIYNDQSEVSESRINYGRKLQSLCDDFDLGVLSGELDIAIGSMLPFFLSYQGYCDRHLQALHGSLVSRIMQKKYLAPALPVPPNPKEPVRVGFVSSFFLNHSNWKIPLKGWMSQLDRKRFRLFGYHVGKESDDQTAVAASMCDRFVHRVASVEDWRSEILTDAPHVLIYPGLLMDELTLLLAAQRLAPVQCNSWGHPETSGMPTLDYFLSSDLMEPEEAPKHYTERLIRLPNLSIYYTAPQRKGEKRTRADFKMRFESVVFWCGQSLFKYLPIYDYVFTEIAARVDNCQFVFLEHQGSKEVTYQFADRLERAFRLKNLKPSDYCLILPTLNSDDFLSAIGQCDLVLDSIGWSGCNSTLEGLEWNLPIVAFQGSLMRGRHSAAILQMMGVSDTIATTIADYVSIAVKLANDPAQRTALRGRISAGKHRVYGDHTCVTALEDFLDRVARGLPPNDADRNAA
jgi:predicted O-linked N-acetylglucosamine transferase (SPINDLY family)